MHFFLSKMGHFRRFGTTKIIVRPQKWEDSQVGFQGSNASGRRIVLLPGAFWAHGASKMAILGASFLLCILQCFRVWEGMLPPGACRMSHASARRIVSCRGLCVSSLCSQIPLAPAPTFGAFRNKERLSRGLDVKWHIPSTCLDASRKWFFYWNLQHKQSF